MRVAVIGGGVIGLALTWRLQRAGADVMLLEERHCGQGASAGNAGWIVPAFSAPVPGPGVTRQALSWLLRPHSPFSFRPRPDVEYLRWLRTFLASSSPARHEAGIAALANLNASTLDDYTRLGAEGVSFEMHEPGLLFVALAPGPLDPYARTLERLSEYGFPVHTRRLDGDEARALEPTLAPSVASALHAPLERCVRPETLTAGLLTAIRDAGGDVYEQTGVRRVRFDGRRWILETPLANFDADKVVLAAGVQSRVLASQMGCRLPLEAAKGYSLTTTTSAPAARHLLYFAETKTAYSAFSEVVRLAGILELGASNTKVSRSRIGTLTRAAKRYLVSWEPSGPIETWAGLRPLTPDGLPLIGAMPGSPGAYIATGHGMIGITLAVATANALAPVILGDAAEDKLAPFAPSRFLY